ncbi:MAG: DegT/DnrJ/EryC1/StrS family aminotransferase [Chloroflexi bacterium]|nr:DegT/DnrJ/EryC1/StrS family aminotransferase [Chloroflexota bacterium]
MPFGPRLRWISPGCNYLDRLETDVTTRTTEIRLAVDGGAPVRTEPFPSWPVWDGTDEEAVLSALRSGRWGSRPGSGFVDAFTTRFASFHQARRAIAVSNGTVALEVALRAVGVGPFDEVIIPAYTFVATATSVLSVGAIPVFADIRSDTYLMDADDAARRITARTKAIVPVHIAGQPCDLDALIRVAQSNGLALIEDAAQAVGASWRGRPIGAIGDIGTLSFQSSKNLNAGEGGALLTDDEALADRAWSLANCGRMPAGAWYHHELAGSNHRMTEIQGALLLSQLDRLPSQFDLREQNARTLDQGLSMVQGFAPQARDERVTGHAHHLYVSRYDPPAFGGRPRAWFLSALRAEGIPCSPGYETPLHRMPAVLSERRKWATHAKECGRQVTCPDNPDAENLPVTDRASREEGVWFGQSVLLGDQRAMHEIVEAVTKVQAWASTH